MIKEGEYVKDDTSLGKVCQILEEHPLVNISSRCLFWAAGANPNCQLCALAQFGNTSPSEQTLNTARVQGKSALKRD